MPMLRDRKYQLPIGFQYACKFIRNFSKTTNTKK